MKEANSAACEVSVGGSRCVVVCSLPRYVRDERRREELLSRTEDKLVALSERVRVGRLSDAAKIGAAADRILRDSGVGRCFVTSTREGSFSWRKYYTSRKGIGSPMSSKARRCVSVGSASRSKVTVVPGTVQVLRVRVPRWSRSPWNGRSAAPVG